MYQPTSTRVPFFAISPWKVYKRHYCSPTRLLQTSMFRLASTIQRKSLSSRLYHPTAALSMVSLRPAHEPGTFYQYNHTAAT